MNTLVQNEAKEPIEHHPVSITFSVNGQSVTLATRHTNGAEIKAAAIAQGLPIQSTFSLILKRPGEASKQIGDDDKVTIHDHLEFSCLPADDNS